MLRQPRSTLSNLFSSKDPVLEVKVHLDPSRQHGQGTNNIHEIYRCLVPGGFGN